MTSLTLQINREEQAMINKATSGNDCGDHGGDCDKAEKLIHSFIDGLLKDAEDIFIRRHLDNCPGCKDGYRFEETFHLRVRALKPVCMPKEVKDQIMIALGFPKASANEDGSPIPKGVIPKGEIPKSDFFDSSGD